METIDSTTEHPFYVEGLGWVEASSLHAGMMIWFADGTRGMVEDISTEGLEEPVTVYNFEVKDFHTYFVGEDGVLVHNQCENGPDLYHYTTAEGAASIEESGVIRPDDRGRVFVTTDEIPTSEVNNALFMGNKPDSGTHVVEIYLKDQNDFKLITDGATQPNELIYNGAIRDGKNATLVVKENPFNG